MSILIDVNGHGAGMEEVPHVSPASWSLYRILEESSL